jgi:hypothetical protein
MTTSANRPAEALSTAWMWANVCHGLEAILAAETNSDDNGDLVSLRCATGVCSA